MAYTKTVWVDEVLDGSPTYEIDGIGGKTIALETTVLIAGTSFNAVSMNKIEDQLAKVDPMTTQGDIIYGGASGTPTRLAKGTAEQVLKMNSGATAPEWGTVSNKIAEVSLTGSSVTISGLDINAHGGVYDIYIDNLKTSSGYELRTHINGDNTSTNYFRGAWGTTGNTADSYTLDSSTSLPCSGKIEMRCLGGYATASFWGERYSATGVLGRSGHWEHKSTQSNITSITLTQYSGTFSSGTVKIYKR